MFKNNEHTPHSTVNFRNKVTFCSCVANDFWKLDALVFKSKYLPIVFIEYITIIDYNKSFLTIILGIKQVWNLVIQFSRTNKWVFNFKTVYKKSKIKLNQQQIMTKTTKKYVN